MMSRGLGGGGEADTVGNLGVLISINIKKLKKYGIVDIYATLVIFLINLSSFKDPTRYL